MYGCETCDCIDPCEHVKCGDRETCVKGLCIFQCQKKYCDKKCENGFVLDDFGCETCECVDPCKNVQCKQGEQCKDGECGKRNAKYAKKNSFPTDSIVIFSVAVCLKQYCRTECEFGFKLDEDGCETCQCVDPCEGVKCGKNQACVYGECGE